MIIDIDTTIPVLISPATESQIDFFVWADHHADYLKIILHQRGAIIFRGFGLKDSRAFTKLAHIVCPNLNTEYGDLAEANPALGLYRSTLYPVEQSIQLHNESAQTTEWPLYLFFFCESPASEGGTTQLVDTRKVLAELSPVLRQQLKQNAFTYTRNHYPYVDTSWQRLYGTDDPRQVEKYCRDGGIEFCWKNRDILHTQVTLSPLIDHPVTGDAVLFHQLFLFHPACLDADTRLSLEQLYHPSDFPRSVTWNNQQCIPDDLVQDLFTLYQKHRIDVQWQQGDVLMIDNAIMAHGRSPFRGERQLLVAMGQMIQTPPLPKQISDKPLNVKPDPQSPLLDLEYNLVYQEFDTVASRIPEAIAICQASREWTYRELKEQTVQIVAVLQDLRLRPSTTVAIVAPRCFELIAAILGVWMNGQVILLIDPNLPERRKITMLQESKTEYLLFIGHPPILNCSIPSFDLNQLPRYSPQSVHLPVLPSAAPAYIFFTSGTAGHPKAILGNHKGLAHFLDWQRSTFDISVGDRIAQLTNISFDVVLRDIFLPLISGATIYLPPETLDLANPWQWLNQSKITRLHTVPSLASVWLRNMPRDSVCDSLKTVFFAGEPLTDTLVRRWRSQVISANTVEIVNLYGPTETTLAKCWYRVPTVPSLGVQPIGHPLPSVQILIVNEQQEVCENGETGEIVIRTPYRTCGYLHNTQSQATGFVLNPFYPDSCRLDDLLYYTGDLGRYNFDGFLEILGRKDDQIKLLGVRIEPQEIAACLLSHPYVNQSFVTGYSQKSTDQPPRLVAFIVAHEEEISPHELMNYLIERLPLAMIPHEFIYITELPLTPNGKVDRKFLFNLLTHAETAASSAITSTAIPPTVTEKTLIRIWQDVLKLDAITIQDNFFQLGGHSLLAMQVLARIRDQFTVPLEIQHIFENPTIATLATYITQHYAIQDRAISDPSEEIIPVEPSFKSVKRKSVKRTGRFPLSFAQERLWFLSQLEPERGVYNIPGAIRFQGLLDAHLLQSCIDALVVRHAALRTCFIEEQGVPKQTILAEARLALEYQDISMSPRLPGSDRLRQIARDVTRAPLPLTQAPLARTILVKESDREHILIYVLHHTIADGWSNLVFNRELQQSYIAGLQGRSVSLPELPVDSVDYSHQERRIFQKSADQLLSFWKNYLSDAPHYLRLPTDRPRPCVQTFNSASCSLILPTDLLRSLQQSFPESNVTLFLKLLTLFKVLLAQYTGDRDIVVGTPFARRQHSNYDSVMGCLINTLAIRTILPDDCTLTTLLDIVRTNLLAAFTHQDAPFDKVVEAVQPPRDLSYHPIFQVLFNYLSFEEPINQAADLVMKREWLVEPETKFDFTLYVREQPSQIHLHLVYNLELFEPKTMEQLLAHYQRLLELAIVQPNHVLTTLPSPEQLGQFRGDRPPTHPFDALELTKPKEKARSATEVRLAAIWQEMLRVDQINRGDNFFALGGYSLLAVRLISRIQQVFDVVISLRSLFTHPTLAELSHHIEDCQNSDFSPIVPGHHNVLSLDQERLWQLHRSGSDQYYFNVPRAIRLTGILDVERLHDAIQVVLQRHSILRSVYLEKSGLAQFTVLSVDKVPLEVINLMPLPPIQKSQQEQRIIDREASYQFDLVHQLPLRLTLLQFSPQEHTLILTAHHIAVDCWSLGLPFQAIVDRDMPWHAGIFLTELFQVYRSMTDHLGDQLPRLPIQFSDFAHWQRQQLQENRFRESAEFWQNQLKKAPRVINLPTDFCPSSPYTLTGVRTAFVVPEALFLELEQLRRNHKTTLFVPLISAFSIAIYQWSGESDLVIGTPVSNRNRPETQHLIGPIANTVVLRIKMNKEQSIAALIDQVRLTAEQSFAYQEYPFTQLVKDFKAESAAHPPLFQIRFILQEAPEKAFDFDDLAIAPIQFDRGVSKYDLSLIMVTQGNKLRGWCEYNTSLFKSYTINVFINLYLRIVQGLRVNSSLSISSMIESNSDFKP